MFDSINISAIIVASISSFALGGLWYSPALFLKPWMQDMNITEDKSSHPAKVFGVAFLFTTLSCIIMSLFIEVGSGFIPGIETGLLIGVGFVFCSFGVNYQFANRSLRALLIDGGYHAIQFTIFGAIIGGWPW